MKKKNIVIMIFIFALTSGFVHANWLQNRYQGLKDWGSRQKYRFDKKFNRKDRYSMPAHKTSKEEFMNYYIKEVGLSRRQAELKWRERVYSKKQKAF